MKRFLSHHEIAALLLLASAPALAVANTANTPDINALSQEQLVEFVTLPSQDSVVQLTPDGHALLKRLGAA